MLNRWDWMRYCFAMFALILISIGCQKSAGTFEIKASIPDAIMDQVKDGEIFFYSAKLLTCKDDKDTKCIENAIEGTNSGNRVQEDFEITWEDLSYGKNRRVYFEVTRFVDGKIIPAYTGNSELFDFHAGKNVVVDTFFWQDGKRDILLNQPTQYKLNVEIPEIFLEELGENGAWFFIQLFECDDDGNCEQFFERDQAVDIEHPEISFLGISNPENVRGAVLIKKERDYNACEHFTGDVYFTENEEMISLPLTRSSCELMRNEKLKDCVKISLSIYNDTYIPYDELENMTELDCEYRQIASLKGIEVMQNLEYLDLSKNELNAIDELRSLDKLIFLSLASNNINDLSPLGNKKSIIYFSFSYNPVENLEPLSTLDNLEILAANGCLFDDLFPISELSTLRALYIASQMSQNIDLTTIKNLQSLEELSLSDNIFVNFDAIQNLENLYDLSMDNVGISDISFMENMPRLMHVSANNNMIKDLSPINSFREPVFMDFEYNCIDTGNVNLEKKPTFLYLMGQNREKCDN